MVVAQEQAKTLKEKEEREELDRKQKELERKQDEARRKIEADIDKYNEKIRRITKDIERKTGNSSNWFGSVFKWFILIAGGICAGIFIHSNRKQCSCSESAAVLFAETKRLLIKLKNLVENALNSRARRN